MEFIPNTDQDREQMLQTIGVQSVDELLEAVPSAVRRPELNLPAPLAEMELAGEMRRLADQNANAHNHSYFLGAGAYFHYVPAAVSQLLLRGEFFTSYTPYQPEVTQGTLQAIFEFQTHDLPSSPGSTSPTPPCTTAPPPWPRRSSWPCADSQGKVVVVRQRPP